MAQKDSGIPQWHIEMVNDEIRNKAYAQAIQNAVLPDSTVFDLGMGAGLLSLYAVRAGAKKVFACELDPLAAGVAAEVLRLNGAEDKVKIIQKKAQLIELGKDLPGPVDILVTEIFDCGLLGENCLTAIQSAKKFLKPGGRIIPEVAEAWVMPVECLQFRKMARVLVEDFKMEPLQRACTQDYVQHAVVKENYRVLAEPKKLLNFNFKEDFALNGQEEVMMPALEEGQIDAIILWFKLKLDSSTSFSTGPMDAPTSFKQSVVYVRKNLKCVKNQPIQIRARYDRFYLSFDVQTCSQES